MKKISLTALILFVSLYSFGQTIQTRFFKDLHLTKEVAAKKAKYSEIITKNADGTTTTEIKDLVSNQIILRNGELFGTWSFQGVKRDFNFELVYTEETCESEIPDFNSSDYFKNKPELDYIAPIIASGESSITHYLGNNIYYPTIARENNISGMVILYIKINKQAKIEEISVSKGCNILLDKEAVRVMRNLVLSSPPKLNGKPIDICILFPIRFTLN